MMSAESNSEKSVSYQKKDGRGHAHPSFFWYDNDKDLIKGLFSRDTPHNHISRIFALMTYLQGRHMDAVFVIFTLWQVTICADIIISLYTQSQYAKSSLYT